MMSRQQGIKASRDRVGEPTSLASSHRGFTLVELLVAVAVLLAVILAMARIFSTATDVTGIGRAAGSIMQEAAVIEQQMRQDIANLSPDGIFAIRQVAVPNNVHGDENLLDPALPADHVFRADQLLFFTDGVVSQKTLRHGQGVMVSGQGTAARMYWGHAFQLPNGLPYDTDSERMHDPQNDLTPWHRGSAAMVRTLLPSNMDAGTVYERAGADAIDGTQPPPRNWLLARQAVALVDDDQDPPASNAKTVYMGGNQTARSIFNDWRYGGGGHPIFGFSREIRNGRVDGAASQLGEIRRWIRSDWNEVNEPPRFWNFDPGAFLTQWDIISEEMLFYPRAERRAPSMHRIDQALTDHVIGSAVSSFIVEWTWDDGTGDLFDEQGNRLLYCIQGSSDCNPGEIRSEKELGFPILTHSEHDSLYGTRLHWHPFGFYTNWHVPRVTPPYTFQPEQPWFGINFGGDTDSFCNICPDRGVGIYSKTPFNSPVLTGVHQVRANYKPADTVFPNMVASFYNDEDLSTIERWADGAAFGPPFSGFENDTGIRVYEAFFGYNRTQPMIESPDGAPTHMDQLYDQLPWDSNDPRIYRELGYTPWPSAIRVTMTLHDPQGRIEGGRTVQFVIELPKRVRGGSQ